MQVRPAVPSLYNFSLMCSSTVPVSSAPAVNGVRRRAMNSYRSFGLVPEIRRNSGGMVMIYVYNSDTVFVNVTPRLQSYQDLWLFTGFRRVEAPARQTSRSTPRDPGTTLAKSRVNVSLMRSLLRLSQSTLKPTRSLLKMSRRERSSSAPPSPREAKRPKLEAPLTSEDYKNGIMLAPMVRSGACKSLTSVGFPIGVCSLLCVLKCLRDFSL